MEIFRINRKFIFFVWLLSISWILINFSVNGHYHKRKNNQIIYHAHPFTKQEKQSQPFQSHKHTDFEYLFFQLISNPLFIIASGFVFLFIQGNSIIIENVFKSVFSIKTYNYSLQYRPPPA